jgi:hypothetical protein
LFSGGIGMLARLWHELTSLKRHVTVG